MQNSHLKLQEIIWEITGRCENGCEYCGSKDTWSVPIDTEKIIEIAKNIAKFPPEEIDISGGDPTLVSRTTHETITEILHKAKVKCKILVNPKSIVKKSKDGSLIDRNCEILSLYDWVGLSINTEEELKLITPPGCFPIEKTTIISNFNLQNIFLYSEIEEFVKEHKLMWQVQYTMYKNPDDPLAIYNNKKALAFFSSQISKSLRNGVRVLVADNANCGGCSAGLNSIGILYNGDVVPCLSMRSWLNIDDVVVGNVFREPIVTKTEGELYQENPLKHIWETRFNKYRFEEFKCCKDHCKNKCVEIKFEKGQIENLKDIFEKNDKYEKVEPIPPLNRMILYGVFPGPGPVKVYGVTYPEGTFVYACPGDWENDTRIYAVKVYGVTTSSSTGLTTNTSDAKTTTHYEGKETKDNGKKKKNGKKNE